jgi:hypothetical protein
MQLNDAAGGQRGREGERWREREKEREREVQNAELRWCGPAGLAADLHTFNICTSLCESLWYRGPFTKCH